MMLFPVNLSVPNYPKPPIYDVLYRRSDPRSEWQTIPERGVVRSREPFKFWWAPTIYL